MMSPSTRSSDRLRVGIDGRILMHYEMRGFARYTVELFRAMKEIAGDNVELISFSPGRSLPSFWPRWISLRGVPGATRDSLGAGGTAETITARRASMFSTPLRTAGCPTGACASTLSPVTTSSIACLSIAAASTGADVGERNMRTLLPGTARIKYITVSDFSKQDICRFYGLSSGPRGGDPQCRQSALS